ncbi:uncharacterized protein PFL1_05672 [Pseudozyma flocculosa PF-1]|uniref:Uncharacterized protein n=1 Tax=Pseudozyma flocculosa PF-1 TaxID=1277687 RepID=A0A061H2K9_9BASI|nr:uncharacterized protein PFL1_05672 [Pseudozyma flocculosa PF-1]EPQ26693.1 hypothetical protein PFL1_05672 [Pseudozyma flocculosa PF-1]
MKLSSNLSYLAAVALMGGATSFAANVKPQPGNILLSTFGIVGLGTVSLQLDPTARDQTKQNQICYNGKGARWRMDGAGRDVWVTVGHCLAMKDMLPQDDQVWNALLNGWSGGRQPTDYSIYIEGRAIQPGSHTLGKFTASG